MRIVHEAQCPEDNPIACAEQDIPPYVHDQRITWFRADPSVHAGLGRGWQASLGLPFDLRVLRVDYETLDGEPFDLPHASIHHRDEVLAGPTDGRLMLRKFARVGKTVIGGGLGTTVPLGRTEPNPYALTEQGLEHQHFQLGTGTFDPILTGQAAWSSIRWGVLGFADARLPLYDNSRGYRPSPSISLAAGPTWKVTPAVQLWGTADGLYEGAEHWDGAPYGGRTALLGSVGGAWVAGPGTVLQAQARTTLWQGALAEQGDEQVLQRLLVTVGASFTLGRHHDDAEEQ